MSDARKLIGLSAAIDNAVLLLAKRIGNRGGIAGLTPVEWKVAKTLFCSEKLSLTEVAHLAGLGKGSVSRSLKILQRFGLADWHKEPDHPRLYAISLTARGREACEKAEREGAANSPFVRLSLTQARQALELLTLALADRM